MKIAVAGILVFEGKALLLHRTEPPVCWGPPGGELKDDESFTDGLKREVFEETGLECMFVMPVETWANRPAHICFFVFSGFCSPIKTPPF